VKKNENIEAEKPAASASEISGVAKKYRAASALRRA